MKSSTSLTARSYRIQQWMEQIRDCNARPSSMTVEDWCREHSITKSDYYYRLREVRKAALDSLPDASEPAPEFVQLALPAAPQKDASVADKHPDVIIRTRSLTIEISNTASEQVLALIGRILEASC